MIVSFLLLISMIVFPAAASVPVDFTPAWSYVGGSGPAVEPLIAGDSVIVALHGRTVVALDARTGQVGWSAVLPEEPADTMVALGESLYIPGNQGTLMVHSLASGSFETAVIIGNAPLLEPLVVADAMVVGDREGTVTILDQDSLEVRSTHVMQTGAVDAISLDGFAVFANRDGLITGLEVATTEVQWQTVTASSPTSLTALDGTILLGTGVGDVFMLSADDGSIQWQNAYTASSMMDFAIAGNEVLGISRNGDLLAFDPGTGDLQWQGVLTTGGYFASNECEPNCLVTLIDGTLTTVSSLEHEIVALGQAIQPIGIRPVSSNEIVVVITRQGDVIAWGLEPG